MQFKNSQNMEYKLKNIIIKRLNAQLFKHKDLNRYQKVLALSFYSQKKDTLPLTRSYQIYGVSSSFQASRKIIQIQHRFQASTITSMDFSHDGKYLATASNDKKLVIYNVIKGQLQLTYSLAALGIQIVRFLHNPHYVLFTTQQKSQFRICYLSLWENKIFFSFLGHTDQILNLQINPLNDLFVSCSRDGTARIFDLYKRECLAIYSGAKCANFDITGYVLALGVQPLKKPVLYQTSDGSSEQVIINSYAINLYNIENSEFPKQPFKSILMSNDKKNQLTSVKFSNNGKYMLVSTVQNMLMMFDAMSGNSIRNFTTYQNSDGLNLQATFSPDSRYIMTGSGNGKIHIWEIDDNEDDENDNDGNAYHDSKDIAGKDQVKILHSHFEPVNCLKMNPKYAVMASACQNIIMWQPEFI